MDNAQKAVMIGVGLFILIIIVAAVMLITGIGSDLLNSGTSQLGGASETLITELNSKYNGTIHTGTQVLVILKQYCNNSQFQILGVLNGYSRTSTIWTSGITYGKWFILSDKDFTYRSSEMKVRKNDGSIVGFNSAKNKDCEEFILTKVRNNSYITPLSDFSNTSEAAYIPRSAKYKSCLVKMNDGVIGIMFIRIS